MSITDELRESVKQACWAMTSKAKWFAIADRIDAEHERELDHVRNQASEGLAKQWNYGYDVGFASADDWLEQHEDAMAEHGYIKLSKDADGVPIHIGDELDGYGYPKGGAYCKAIVNEVTILAGLKDSSYRSWLMWDVAEVRHHKPTIEDVLREFGDKYCDMVADSDKERELFAEYAAKLRLANSEEQ